MKEVLDYNVKPANYKLRINVEEDYFTGEETVLLKVIKETKQFNFNIWKMEIKDLILQKEGATIKTNFEIKEEIVTVYFDESLKESTELNLIINFKGTYSEDMWGFCKSQYKEDLLFSTDFEPTCARRAFPCWDQPDMKATFDISIKPFKGHKALSNSSLKEIKDGVYYFNTTPMMSTYIVAFISGNLESITNNTIREIPISVYAHKEEVEWGRYALKVAIECLDYFEGYFGINYPLPKLDLVAIPAFVSGAMENWGLVTFRKTSLLFVEGSTSLRSKKLIAETVCHELAHMWFGNLVTMAWWNDLWLNEGFATWAASLAMSNLTKVLVDWEVWTEFINSDVEVGMFYDCLESTHPIAVNVEKPSEISQIFDSISYSKGASMIRMLEGYVGEDEFRRAIRDYLNKFKYSNATTQDLWNSFDSKFNVNSLMNDWINKGGFPLVTVTEDGDDLILEQKQFLLSGKETNALWCIPITFNWEETILMKEKQLKVKKNSNIYKINLGAFGFYRASYESQNLFHLLEIVTSVDDKLNVINDVYALCTAKLMKAIDVIVLSELFRTENNPEILSSVFNTFNKFRSLWYENKSVCKHINEVVMDIVGTRVYEIDIYNTQLGVEETITNSLLVSNALKCGDKKIKEKLSKAFENKNKVNPEYIRSIFNSVVDDKFEELFEIIKNNKIPEEKVIAMSSLGSISCPENLETILNRYNEFEAHDSLYFFIGLGANESNREIILNYLCDNFDSIRTFMRNDRLFSYVIERVLCLASTKLMADKVIDVLNKKKDEEIVMAIKKTIEKIGYNLSFKEFNSDLVKN